MNVGTGHILYDDNSPMTLSYCPEWFRKWSWVLFTPASASSTTAQMSFHMCLAPRWARVWAHSSSFSLVHTPPWETIYKLSKNQSWVILETELQQVMQLFRQLFNSCLDGNAWAQPTECLLLWAFSSCPTSPSSSSQLVSLRLPQLRMECRKLYACYGFCFL